MRERKGKRRKRKRRKSRKRKIKKRKRRKRGMRGVELGGEDGFGHQAARCVPRTKCGISCGSACVYVGIRSIILNGPFLLSIDI